jgi:hypothetical protein
MPLEQWADLPPADVPGRRPVPATALGLLVAACLTAGCTSLTERLHPTTAADKAAAASSAAVAEDLQKMAQLIRGTPSEQSEILAAAQHDYDTAPTPPHVLRLALVLATPGHPGTNATRAHELLQEVTTNPEALGPGDRVIALGPGQRMLAAVELQQIDDYLTLQDKAKKLSDETARADHLATLNRHLQAEADKAPELKKELEEARAKLEAIATMERTLNERSLNEHSLVEHKPTRKPHSSEGQPQ